MTRTAVLVVLSACAFSLGGLGAPELVVDRAAFAFPDTVEGLSVSQVFVLTNTGDQETVIASAEPSCSCTKITVHLEQLRLAPGQSTTLDARLETSGLSGFVNKKLFVKSSAPGPDGDYEVELSFKGRVVERRAHQSTVADLTYELYLLIDVRDPSAYAAGHLIGALNIPAYEVATRAADLPPTAMVVIYDETGAVSGLGTVIQALHSAGIASVYPLRGGYSGWQASYGAARTARGPDTSWGGFLDVSGARSSSQPVGVMSYEASRLLDDCVLVDLRSPQEYAAGHLAGSTNLSEADLAAYVQALGREVPVVVYSSDGVAGDQAAAALRAQGRRVTNLLGGLAEWRRLNGNYLVVASGS